MTTLISCILSCKIEKFIPWWNLQTITGNYFYSDQNKQEEEKGAGEEGKTKDFRCSCPDLHYTAINIKCLILTTWLSEYGTCLITGHLVSGIKLQPKVPNPFFDNKTVGLKIKRTDSKQNSNSNIFNKITHQTKW